MSFEVVWHVLDFWTCTIFPPSLGGRKRLFKITAALFKKRKDTRSFPVLCRWQQIRWQESWVLLSHGWRTLCRSRSVRWLARWPRPHLCRPPLPPPPPHLCPRLPSHRPRLHCSVLTMRSCLQSSRNKTGKWSAWSFLWNNLVKIKVGWGVYM